MIGECMGKGEFWHFLQCCFVCHVHWWYHSCCLQDVVLQARQLTGYLRDFVILEMHAENACCTSTWNIWLWISVKKGSRPHSFSSSMSYKWLHLYCFFPCLPLSFLISSVAVFIFNFLKRNILITSMRVQTWKGKIIASSFYSSWQRYYSY